MTIYRGFVFVVYLVLLATMPAWAQDGLLDGKIVYEDIENRIVIYDPTTNQEVVLLDDGHYNVSPDLSPDGTQIVFLSDRDGDLELYVVNVDGTNLRQLTYNSVRDSAPVWSPDGTKIAYISEVGRSDDLFTINVDDLSIYSLTQGVGFVRYPTWSPDGQRIAFILDQAGRDYTIVSVIDADGRNRTQLTDDGKIYTTPAWSPDGTKIAVNGPEENYYYMNADGTGLTRIIIDEESTDRGYFAWLSNDAIVFDTPQQDYRINIDGSDRTPINLTLPQEAQGTAFSRLITPLEGQAVISFSLVDAATDEDIYPLYNGYPTSQRNITIRANTEPPRVGSVVFGLDEEPRYKVENEPNYALAGDRDGDYFVWQAEPGTYTLTATPYTEADGRGEAGTPLTITFTVEAPGS